MSDVVTIARFGSHIEADLAKSALDASGIAAWVTADDAGGQGPYLDFAGGVSVLVRSDDAEAAREVLEGPKRRLAGDT